MKNSYLFSLCLKRQLLVLCFVSLYSNHRAAASLHWESEHFLLWCWLRGKEKVFPIFVCVNYMALYCTSGDEYVPAQLACLELFRSKQAAPSLAADIQQPLQHIDSL